MEVATGPSVAVTSMLDGTLVAEALTSTCVIGVSVALADGVRLGLSVYDTVADSVGIARVATDCVAVLVEVAVWVTFGVALGSGDAVTVRVAVKVRLGVGEAVGV